jgi:hypothetical protein
MAATTARKNFIPGLFVDLESIDVPNALRRQCIVDGDWQCIVPVCFGNCFLGTLGPGVVIGLLTCFFLCIYTDIYLMVSTEYYFGTTFGRLTNKSQNAIIMAYKQKRKIV